MSVLAEEALQIDVFGSLRPCAFGPAGAWHPDVPVSDAAKGSPSNEGYRRASTPLARPIQWVVKKKTALLLALASLACAAIAGDSSGAAASYPSPLNLRSSAGSVSGSWTLDAASGAADLTTSTVSIDGALDGGWYAFAPGASSSTRLATIPTAADGTGWIVDPAGGASGFPAGNWTFTVETVVQGASLDAGAAVLTVGMWTGTISSGVFTPVATILDPTDDPAAQDLRSNVDVTTSVTFSLPKFSIGAGETLFVELWRHQVDGISDSTDANRELDLSVNDGVSAIGHPGADSTAPTHALSVTALSGNSVFDSGSSVLYYDGSSDGSFTVDDTIADAGSGPLQVTYPLVSTSGWTHGAETVSTGPDYTSATYSWTSGSTDSPGDQTIVAEDQALQTSTATLTLTNDTTPPTGQTVALSGGPDYSTLSVPLTLVNGSDAGVGIDSASGVVERASATASGGSCGSFGSYAAVTLTSGADTTVSAGNCYRYRYLISDLLGNQSAPSADSADAIIDTSTPTVVGAAPTELTGAGDQFWDAATGTIWFRPAASGSFTMNATAEDGESGIDQVAFPDVSTTTGWSGSTGGTDTTDPFSSPVAYTWTASAAAPGARLLTATNTAGVSGTGTITLSADSTPPTGPTIALSGGPWFATLSVPLTIGAGSDAGAGIDAARGVVERASAPLTNGVCGTFGSYAAVTLTSGADTTVVSGNCYRYQYKATDNVGNVSAASTASADAQIDTSPPTVPTLIFGGLSNASVSGSVVYYRPGGAGAFTVTAASADGDSGIASYTFPSVAGFTATGTGASRTYTFTSAPSAPLAPLAVTAVNGAGQASAGASFTLVPDPIAPTVIVLCNGRRCSSKPYANPVVVTMSAGDGLGSGVSTIRYTTNGSVPTPTGNEYVRAFTVLSLTPLRARAYDRAGNASSVAGVTIRLLADRLVFGVPPRASVKASARYLQARVSSTRKAKVAAVMSGKGLKKPERWRFTLGSGASIVQLRLPKAIKRPGRYNVVWNVTSGSKKSKKTMRVTLLRPAKKK